MQKPGTLSNSTTEDPSLHRKKIIVSRIKRKILRHVWMVRIGLVAGGLVGVYLIFLFLGFLFAKFGLGNYSQLLVDFLFTPSSQIKSAEGRTNLLILGKAGEGHIAPDLTDTIIFASVSNISPEVTLVSLPRDIWIPELRAKLNSAYYWGNQRQEMGGLILAKSTVEEIVGVPIQYGVVIDFNGFKALIDTLGGIEVEVERSFVDERYPIPGREDDLCEGDTQLLCRYETIRFEAGKRKMSGELALKFVRSRNAEGEEGTDLARAARQQKLVNAVIKKLLSPATFLSPKKLLAVFNVVKESTETDIDSEAVAILARRFIEAADQMESFVISEEFLLHPPVSPEYDNQYVFTPKAGDWSEVHGWIKDKLP